MSGEDTQHLTEFEQGPAPIRVTTTMNMGVHRIAADPSWRTPAKVFAELDSEFRFTLDPCASSPIRRDIEWFGEADNGLWREWSGRVFVNPPYGRAIADWMRKITVERNRCEVIVGLIPARTDTEWWHEHVMPADEVRFIRGRLSFEGVEAPKGHNAPFPSVIVVWRPMTQAAAPLEAVRTCQQLLTGSDGARRYCAQTVAVTHWFDTTGHEHAACSRHVASMKSRWVPEAAVPGVFVSEAEARALWDAPESADPITAAKAERERALA